MNMLKWFNTHTARSASARWGARLMLLFFAFHFSHSAFAQVIGSWQVYPAYTVCTKTVPVGNRVYALMESNLMAYDTEDTSIATWNSMNGLNDVGIQFVDYSAEAQRLILVYGNGNIDLLSTQDDGYIVNISTLKSSSLQGKNVTSVSIDGTYAYICTGFGLVVVDMQNALIAKTYRLGLVVNACAVFQNHIYLGTTTGIWRGSISDNLQDKNNWKQVSASYRPTMMAAFDGSLFIRNGNTILSSHDGIAFATAATITAPLFMHVSDGALLVGSKATLLQFSSATQSTSYATPGTWTWVARSGSTYWAADGTEGLQAYKLDGNTFGLTTSGIHPNSPLHDYTYHLRLVDDRLFVAGGNYNYSPKEGLAGTAMILEPDGTWLNLSAASAAEVAPQSRFLDVTHVAVSPTDPHHYYVGTARSGLYEFQDDKCTAHHGTYNSTLQSILPDDAHKEWFVVADGTRFDADGNLWMLNGTTDSVINVLHPDGTWKALYYSELEGVSALDNILFDSKGRLWANSRRMGGRGVFFLDFNGTPDQVSDDRHFLRSGITNQDGTSYSPDEYYALAEDYEGCIWVATQLGPFVITEPDDFTSSDFAYTQVKVNRNDGSGLADYLLNGIAINAIAIDGANRKWFATQSNGVYLMSADCQDELQHFTADNSPLLSDEVFDIAINGQTGQVYFATSKGLCSYVTDATVGIEELSDDELFAYPNPVTPEYNGTITIRGMEAGSEVKILSSTGQLIWRGVSNGGTFTWNGCNRQGRRVASGIYIVVASNASGKKAATTKIAVIR